MYTVTDGPYVVAVERRVFCPLVGEKAKQTERKRERVCVIADEYTRATNSPQNVLHDHCDTQHMHIPSIRRQFQRGWNSEGQYGYEEWNTQLRASTASYEMLRVRAENR